MNILLFLMFSGLEFSTSAKFYVRAASGFPIFGHNRRFTLGTTLHSLLWWRSHRAALRVQRIFRRATG
jgi:hypothetical protein